jgi:copper chaperone NosL
MSEAEAVLLSRSLRFSPQESALEQGWLLAEMEQRFGYGLDELARRFDRSPSWVSRRLALVELLPEVIQQQVREGKLAAQVAMKYLVPVARINAADCTRMAAAFVAHGCNTRQAGQLYTFLDKTNAYFDRPLGKRGRLTALVAALLLIPTFFFPLWNMTLFSNQFRDGLDLHIYSYALVGGHTASRDDLREINTLNHYIGMRPLLESDFSEFTWLPLMIGIFFILALRAVVIGKVASLVDTAVLFMYSSLFSLWSFYHRMCLSGASAGVASLKISEPCGAIME